MKCILPHISVFLTIAGFLNDGNVDEYLIKLIIIINKSSLI